MNISFAFLRWHGRFYAGYFDAWSAAMAGKQAARPVADSEQAAKQRWEAEGGAPMRPADWQ